MENWTQRGLLTGFRSISNEKTLHKDKTEEGQQWSYYYNCQRKLVENCNMSVKKSNSTKSRSHLLKKKRKGKKVFEQRLYIGPGSDFVKQPKG